MSKQIKLLVVDDETRFLKTLSDRLSLRDFDVTAASSGMLALKAAENRIFDVALVDLKMPGISGDQLLKILKDKHPYIEVVILTGHGSVDSAVKCTQLGSYGYLQKPCETDELLEVLKGAYQKRVQRRLNIDEDKMSKLLETAAGESPLNILRKLKELEDEKGM